MPRERLRGSGSPRLVRRSPTRGTASHPWDALPPDPNRRIRWVRLPPPVGLLTTTRGASPQPLTDNNPPTGIGLRNPFALPVTRASIRYPASAVTSRATKPQVDAPIASQPARSQNLHILFPSLRKKYRTRLGTKQTFSQYLVLVWLTSVLWGREWGRLRGKVFLKVDLCR